MKDNPDSKAGTIVTLFISSLIIGLLIYVLVADLWHLRSGLNSNDSTIVLKSFAVYVVLFAAVFSCGICLGRLAAKVRDESRIRRDALKRSRAVLGGLAAEQVAPFLPDFPCNPSDVRFVGKPIDFVGFLGMTETGKVNEVLFIEVKTGGSELSDIERQIRTAIEKKKVRYVEYRI
ncbi:MAG: Holliday junction resolvase [Spirochaetales bacterium]|nr:Holliday junction resolvase [Spirochaetales bacterium]